MNIEPYKRKISRIHPPEELIAQTRQKMHEVNAARLAEGWERQNAHPRFKRGYLAAVLAACACLLAIVGVGAFTLSQPKIVKLSVCVETTDYAAFYKAPGKSEVPMQASISKEEYAGLSGYREANAVRGYQLVEASRYCVAANDGESSEAIGIFQYANGAKGFTLTVSQHQVLAPVTLLLTESVNISNVSVFIGQDDETGTFRAAWSTQENYFYLRSDAVGSLAFLRILRTLLTNP